MKQIAVSVIVPVYKVEPYLEKCICSLLNQTDKDMEIILVDDGSPDSCPAICDRYAAENACIRVIHKENGGVSSARNVGLDAANGEYVWFVDSDDSVAPNAIATMRKYIEESVDLLAFNRKVPCLGTRGEINGFMKDYYFPYVLGLEPWNKIYKRSIIEEHHLRFDTQERVGEDLLFNAMYYKHMSSFVSILDKIYCYLVRADSAMGKGRAERPVQQMRIYKKLLHYYDGAFDESVTCGLFLVHLVTGLSQAEGSDFTKADVEKHIAASLGEYSFSCKAWIDGRKFLESGEKPTIRGRMRLRLLTYFLRHKCVKAAARIAVFGW